MDRRAHPFVAVVISAVLVGSTSCARDQPERGAPREGPSESTRATVVTPVEVEAPPPDVIAPADLSTQKVVIQSPGSLPRRALRYALRAGSKESAWMVMGTSMTITSEGRADPMTPPLVRMEYTLEVDRITPDNHAVLGLTIRAADAVGDAGTAAGEAAVARLAGTMAEYC